MKIFLSFLKLIRLPNLLIVALTQYALRYLIIIPSLKINAFSPILNSAQFSLLVLCTLIIAAAGYIINDYYDIEIDRINKNEQQILGNHFTESNATFFYRSMLIFGAAIAILLAYQLNLWKLIYIYPLACGLLYLYARYLKKIAFIGNLIVSSFTAFVVLIVFISEFPIISTLANEDQTYLLQLAYGFTIFSFLSNFFRELIKDIEDMKGDQLFGAKTAPVIFGIPWTKTISSTVLIILFGYSLYFITLSSIEKYAYQYIWLGLIFCLPIIFMIYKLLNAKQKNDYSLISKLSKAYMILGILALFSLIKYPVVL